MSVFDFEEYRKFVRKTFLAMPKQGHGQAKKLAAHLQVSTTLISQILSEQKHFTLDQAFMCAEFLSLNDSETRYFLGLVQLEKASSPSFKQSLIKTLKAYKQESQQLENRLTHQQVLSDEQKAVFYSDWHYSAIRMLTSIDGYDNLESLAGYLGLPKKMVSEALQFLEATRLIVSEKNKFKIGPLSTHVNADSSWVKLHHTNWRSKAVEHLNYPDPQKLHYTSPMTLSKNDVAKIRENLVRMIGEIGKTVDNSPAEQLMCLNIDWFQIPSK